MNDWIRATYQNVDISYSWWSSVAVYGSGSDRTIVGCSDLLWYKTGDFEWEKATFSGIQISGDWSSVAVYGSGSDRTIVGAIGIKQAGKFGLGSLWYKTGDNAWEPAKIGTEEIQGIWNSVAVYGSGANRTIVGCQQNGKLWYKSGNSDWEYAVDESGDDILGNWTSVAVYGSGAARTMVGCQENGKLWYKTGIDNWESAKYEGVDIIGNWSSVSLYGSDSERTIVGAIKSTNGGLWYKTGNSVWEPAKIGSDIIEGPWSCVSVYGSGSDRTIVAGQYGGKMFYKSEPAEWEVANNGTDIIGYWSSVSVFGSGIDRTIAGCQYYMGKLWYKTGTGVWETSKNAAGDDIVAMWKSVAVYDTGVNRTIAGCEEFLWYTVAPFLLTYELSPDTTEYYVTGYTGEFKGYLKIPRSYNGKPVTQIKTNAFKDICTFPKSGTLVFESPSNVHMIADGAFYNDSGFINQLTLTENLASIGNNAFYDCTPLFGNTVVIPVTVENIGSSAFLNCTNITNVVLNRNQTLYPNSFPNNIIYTVNSTLASVINIQFQSSISLAEGSSLPGGLTLVSNTLSGTPESLGVYDFTLTNGTENLNFSIVVKNPFSIDYQLSPITNEYYISGFIGVFEGGVLTIPSTHDGKPVTKILENAFNNLCTLPTSGTLSFQNPSNITTIEGAAFSECSGFTGSLSIPEGVTTIGAGAFAGCSGFNGSLTLPSTIQTIGDLAFGNCSGFVGSLVIPGSVTSIGDAAFGYCSGFTGTLTIVKGVVNKTIGAGAFGDCSGFTGNLTIPATVTAIGAGAFSHCMGFDGLGISGNIDTIPEACFAFCYGFTGSLVIPETVTTIGQGAFAYCKGLTGSLVIPETVTSIGVLSFSYCPGFSGSLTLNAEVGEYAFAYCSGFTGSLTVNDSVGDYAFAYCSGFTGYLDINNGVNTIGDYAFALCSGFTGSLNIPGTVTGIGKGAFVYCSGFTGSLNIPGTVTSIGDGAFAYCYGFTGSLNIQGTVTSIGDYAFALCSEFTGSLNIPETVTSIGEAAFGFCSGFTGSLNIPETVTSIGNGAFRYCSGFTGSLKIPLNIDNIGSIAFSNCNFDSIILNSNQSLFTDSFENNSDYIVNISKSGSLNIKFKNVVSLASGSLPSGITLEPYELGTRLTGTPTVAGNYEFVLTGSTLNFQIIFDQPICILENTKILTVKNGYEPISNIKPGDFVISAKTNGPVKVIDIGFTMQNKNNTQSTNIPFLIRKNAFGVVPISDLYLSGHHAVFLEPDENGVSLGVQTFKLQQATTLPFENNIKYFYVYVENGDPIVAGGIAIESTRFIN